MFRQICCHKTDHRPLYECMHIIKIKSEGTFFEKTEICGNLMHTDCIERLGKCHKNSGVKKHVRSARDS